MKQSSAQSTIDTVLRENKILSMTLYVVAVLSVLCGIVILGFGVWRNQPIIALAGAVETYLFIPAWRSAQELRREKKLIRLLERRLNRGRTASEAVDTLRNPFKEDTPGTGGDHAS
jgi:hypothetical protein